MLTRVFSAAVQGVEATEVEVEVNHLHPKMVVLLLLKENLKELPLQVLLVML